MNSCIRRTSRRSRCSTVYGRKVVSRRTTWITKHLEARTSWRCPNFCGISRSGSDSTCCNLSAVASGQRILYRSGADRNDDRRVDGCRRRDVLRHNNAVFAVVGIASGRNVDHQRTSGKCNILRNHKPVAKPARIFTGHIIRSFQSMRGGLPAPQKCSAVSGELFQDHLLVFQDSFEILRILFPKFPHQIVVVRLEQALSIILNL